MNLEPINQTKLYGINDHLKEIINLFDDDKLPNKILLSGQKGLGKSTLAYHLINYILSKNEENSYNKKDHIINDQNYSFKLTNNKSNPNLYIIDIPLEKKNIDINQIRNMISNLYKSSFNDKPRIILIDNIEYLNINSINALLKVLEEPSENTYFILINNNKKVLPTLLSRCLNFKVSLNQKDTIKVINNLIHDNVENLLNTDLLIYYTTPGNLYRLIKFANLYEYDLSNITLRDFLKLIIEKRHFKKDNFISYFFFELIEYYFLKSSNFIDSDLFNKYDSFMNKIHNMKKYNLDEEAFFIEFKEEILNG